MGFAAASMHRNKHWCSRKFTRIVDSLMRRLIITSLTDIYQYRYVDYYKATTYSLFFVSSGCLEEVFVPGQDKEEDEEEMPEKGDKEEKPKKKKKKGLSQI